MFVYILKELFVALLMRRTGSYFVQNNLIPGIIPVQIVIVTY